jgi:hypothetical protein
MAPGSIGPARNLAAVALMADPSPLRGVVLAIDNLHRGAATATSQEMVRCPDWTTTRQTAELLNSPDSVCSV